MVLNARSSRNFCHLVFGSFQSLSKDINSHYQIERHQNEKHVLVTESSIKYKTYSLRDHNFLKNQMSTYLATKHPNEYFKS